MSLDRRQQAEQRLSEALAALGAGLVEQAAAHLRETIKLRPDSPDAWLALARLHLETGRPREALSDLDAHDQYHPERAQSPAARFLRARVLIRCGEDELALAYLEKLCAEFHDD